MGTETDPMGSTRPDMNWHSTPGDRDNYPDDRYPSRYPSSMPGRFPNERPGMYPGGEYGDRYPTSPIPDRYPSERPGERPGAYPYDRYNPDMYGPPMSGADRDRYPGPPRMPGMDRYPPPPGSVDPYYPMMPGRYPMMPSGDRYPSMQGGDRYPSMAGGDRYPPMGPDRYPPMVPYPRPGIGDPLDSSKYPPVPSNRYPDDDRYGNRDPYANKDRYNPDGPGPVPGMYPDTRAPPSRGQPIDRPNYGGEQPYGVRYPDGPIMGPPYGQRYPTSENRFPVGTDRFPTNIFKYGNRERMPPYQPAMGGYMPYPVDPMIDRGYGQRAPRPPYAIMVGFGGQQGGENSISDTYGMPYGKFAFT